MVGRNQDDLLLQIAGKIGNVSGKAYDRENRESSKGKMIVFWSPIKGCNRLTGCMLMTGCCMATETEYNITLTQTPGRNELLEEAFDGSLAFSRRGEVYKKTGLSALLLAFKGGRLDKERVRQCSAPTSIENLSFFVPGTGFSELAAGEEKVAGRALILNSILNSYDFVLLDVGTDDSLIREADYVVCLLPQNIRSIKKFITDRQKHKEEWDMLLKKTVFVINGYMKKSSNNVRTISFLFGIKPLTIPFSVEFMDAVSDGVLSDFFEGGIRSIKCREFYSSVKSLAERIASCGD